MKEHTKQNYTQAVKVIKSAIIQSRYQAARNINREILALYYQVGQYISINSRDNWGCGAIASISKQLQQELPGLRGFSEGNMRKMRIFFEQWQEYFENRSLVTHDFATLTFNYNQADKICALTTHKLSNEQAETFLSVPFTHHYEIIKSTNTLQERFFYISLVAREFWSVEKLKYNLAEKLYEKQASMPNNFKRTILAEEQQRLATKAFRDEYLLDFVTINDTDAVDEKVIETTIVKNIRKFILALGNDFSFMGNQYRLIIDNKEYFIDLLFFNRKLQSLVAIELKWTEFKPEYVGKLNFYLSALDEMIRLPHEKPSIGVILCRGKSAKTVDYALRDTAKPMGVATYRAANELPSDYYQVLEQLEGLKELL